MLYIKEEKLKQISLTSHSFAVLMDFDKTISTIDSEDSWTVIQNPSFVSPKIKMESTKLLEKYYPIEMDYHLSLDEKSSYMYRWYTEVLNLYYKYGLTYDKLISCVQYGKIVFRNGVKELFFDFYKNKIPVVILSAGIGNVIALFLELNHCLYDNIHIVSNFLSFKDNALLPIHHNIIHTCNKTLSLLPDILQNQVCKKDAILLFGDYIEDIKMVPKDFLNKTLSFGFLEKNVDANLDLYRNSFDVVLTDNASFYDIRDMINKLIEKAN